MYIQEQFKPKKINAASRFCNNYPFATIVTYDDGDYHQSYTPIIVMDDGDTFQFHLSRSNPHTKALKANSYILLSFLGPHGYVPPSWFVEDNLVPTWNYMTVQVKGNAKEIDGRALTTQLEKMSLLFNNLYDDNWTNMFTLDLNHKLQSMIVGYEVSSTVTEAKFKLSQNRTSESLKKYKDKMLSYNANYFRHMIEELEDGI